MRISKMSLPERPISRSKIKDPYCVKSKTMEQLKCEDTCPDCHKGLYFHKKFTYKEKTANMLRKFNIKPSYVIIKPQEIIICENAENQLTSKLCTVRLVERAERQHEFKERIFFKNGMNNVDILDYCLLEQMSVEDLISNLETIFDELVKYGIHPESLAKIYFQREKNISRFISSLHQFRSMCLELEKKTLRECSERKEKSAYKDKLGQSDEIVDIKNRKSLNDTESVDFYETVSMDDSSALNENQLINMHKLKNGVISLVRLEDMDIDDNIQPRQSMKISPPMKEYAIPSSLKISLPNNKNDRMYTILKDLTNKIKQKNKEKSKITRNTRKGNFENYKGTKRIRTRYVEKEKDAVEDVNASEFLESEDFENAEIANIIIDDLSKQKKGTDKSESLSQSQNKEVNYVHKPFMNRELIVEIERVNLKEILDIAKDIDGKLTSGKVVETHEEETKPKGKEKDTIEDVNTSEFLLSENFENTHIATTIIDLSKQKKGTDKPESLSQSQNEDDMHVHHMESVDSIEGIEGKLTREKVVEIHEEKTKPKVTSTIETKESVSEVNKDTSRRMKTLFMEKKKDSKDDVNASEFLQSENFQIAEVTFTINEGMLEPMKDFYETESSSQSQNKLENANTYKSTHERVTSEKVVEVHKEETKSKDNIIKKGVSKVNKDTGRRMRTRSMEKKKENLDDVNADKHFQSEKFQIDQIIPTVIDKSEKKRDIYEPKLLTNRKLVVLLKDIRHMESSYSIKYEKLTNEKDTELKVKKPKGIGTKRRTLSIEKEKDNLNDVNEHLEPGNTQIARITSMVGEGIGEDMNVVIKDVYHMRSADNIKNKDEKQTDEIAMESFSEKTIPEDNTQVKESALQFDREMKKSEGQNIESSVVEDNASIENAKFSESIKSSDKNQSSVIEVKETEKEENVEETFENKDKLCECDKAVDIEDFNSESLYGTVEESVEFCKSVSVDDSSALNEIEKTESKENVEVPEERFDNKDELCKPDKVVDMEDFHSESLHDTESVDFCKSICVDSSNLSESENVQESCIISDDKSLEKMQSKNEFEEQSMEITIDRDVEESEESQNIDSSLVQCENVGESLKNFDESQPSLIDTKETERTENVKVLEENLEYNNNFSETYEVVDMENIESVNDTEVESIDFHETVSMDYSSTLDESEKVKEPCASNEHKFDGKSLKEQSKEKIKDIEDSKTMLLEHKADVEKPKYSFADFKITDVNNNPYYDLYFRMNFDKSNVKQAELRVMNRKSHCHLKHLPSSMASTSFVQMNNFLNNEHDIFAALHEHIGNEA